MKKLLIDQESFSLSQGDFLIRLMVAIGIGSVIGLERQFMAMKENAEGFAGIRTFAFWVFLGFIAALFFSCQEKGKLPQSPTSELLTESFLAWNGDSLPSYPLGKPKISIVKVTIPPHSELPHHYHPVINAGVLLKGELTVIDVKGNVLEMKAGDPIIEVVNTIHYGKNNGDVPAEILVFYAGAAEMEIVVKDTPSRE